MAAVAPVSLLLTCRLIISSSCLIEVKTVEAVAIQVNQSDNIGLGNNRHRVCGLIYILVVAAHPCRLVTSVPFALSFDHKHGLVAFCQSSEPAGRWQIEGVKPKIDS